MTLQGPSVGVDASIYLAPVSGLFLALLAPSPVTLQT